MAGTPRLAPIVEARASGKSYHPVRGQVGVFLRGARGPLVAGEIHPDAIPDGKVRDPFPECVDDTSTVLVGSYLRKRRRCTAAGAKAGLPVGGVDAGDDDADTDLARPGSDTSRSTSRRTDGSPVRE